MTTKASNRLIHEKSPYLLQHAHNPVDWYPWGEKAFSAAKERNSPIFLSVGYSTCHWCHVMEHESFENNEIAEALNQNFVNIKLDREERPDIDRVYMAYVQLVNGSGGWPMSVFLTPDLKPFFGGSYFPPEDRYGRAGFASLIKALAKAWKNDQQGIESTAMEAFSHMQQMLSESSSQSYQLSDSTFSLAFSTYKKAYDPHLGGFGRAPKFPRPAVFDFLMVHSIFDHEEKNIPPMITKSLSAMNEGGIHDHLGGGFHRYSVDRSWHVPHFEKMLYDQAQLVVSYLQAAILYNQPLFFDTAKDIIEYSVRDLFDKKESFFYSAEDADSLNEKNIKKEGAFYVFSIDEIKKNLGNERKLFNARFGVLREGNADDPHGEFEGKNILHIVRSIEELREEFSLDEGDIIHRLDQAKQKLLAYRNRRPRPHLDDKMLCSWNAMMIKALALAARYLPDEDDRQRYKKLAHDTLHFLLDKLYPEKKNLFRRYRQNDVAFAAGLEDYATLIDALICLYQLDFDPKLLKLATALQEQSIKLFKAKDGGFYSNVEDDPSVLIRAKDDYDGAEPSGNSISAINLLRLSILINNSSWRDLAESTINASSVRLQQSPFALPKMLVAAEILMHGLTEITIIGDKHEIATQKLLKKAHQLSLADTTIIHYIEPNDQKRKILNETQKDLVKRFKSKSLAMVCHKHQCSLPTDSLDEFQKQLNDSFR